MTQRRTIFAVVMALGLGLPMLAWAAALQLGEILPYRDCVTQSRGSAMAAAIAAVVAMACAGVPRALARSGFMPESVSRPTVAFIGSVAALTAGVLVYATILQIIAGLVLTGCER